MTKDSRSYRPSACCFSKNSIPSAVAALSLLLVLSGCDTENTDPLAPTAASFASECAPAEDKPGNCIPAPPPAPPPPGGEWDRVLADTAVVGDVVVPDGQRWLIGPNVQVRGNVRTHNGTIGMRPGSTLRLLGGDPEQYVGGGMHYGPQFANDIGIWVGAGHGATGMLDIACTAKTGWNRTGVDPSWSADDEYWIAPTEMDDYRPRRWYPGEAIPQIDPRVPAAEVMNVTRDCLIEGPGHIHIHSSVPQRIEYVTLRRMGIGNSRDGATTGRYAIHLHHGRDGVRGTIIRGVAAIESGGRVFVPHGSHGVTLIDNVSVNGFAEGLWWDQNGSSLLGPHDRSNDILVDRLAVSGVHFPRAVSGGTSRTNAVVLAGGDNLVIRNSAVSGARGSNLSTGFDWPSAGDNFGDAIWEFSEGNVAHNNEGPGLRFWFNNAAPHRSLNFASYNNKANGITNGAYTNAIRYSDAILLNNGIQHSSSSRAHRLDGGPARYERVQVYAGEGPALNIGRLRLGGGLRTEFIDCTLEAGPGAPKVQVNKGGSTGNPFIALFRRCGVTPDDIDIATPFPPDMEGTNILIEHESGTRWEITLDIPNQQKIVRVLP